MATSYGYAYVYVTAADGSERIFAGNADVDTIVEHCFEEVQARFVRLFPQTWHSYMSMRWEIYVLNPPEGITKQCLTLLLCNVRT